MARPPAPSYQYSLHGLLPAENILLLTGEENKKRTFEQATLLLESISSKAIPGNSNKKNEEDKEKLNRNDLFRQFMQRERQGSTSIGFYGAIPHIHMETIDKPLCVLVRLKKPIQYDADNAPTSEVHTLFFVVVPADNPKLHLKLLAIFSHILGDEELMHKLALCATPQTVYKELAVWDRENHTTLNDIWAQE